MIKITANSMWRKQAELLMLQIEKHMSKQMKQLTKDHTS